MCRAHKCDPGTQQCNTANAGESVNKKTFYLYTEVYRHKLFLTLNPQNPMHAPFVYSTLDENGLQFREMKRNRGLSRIKTQDNYVICNQSQNQGKRWTVKRKFYKSIEFKLNECATSNDITQKRIR